MTTRGQNLKRRLRVGEVTIAAWISFVESAVAEIMAGTGFDWILIDTEHAPLSPEGLQTVIMAFNGRGRRPIRARAGLDTACAIVTSSVVDKKPPVGTYQAAR